MVSAVATDPAREEANAEAMAVSDAMLEQRLSEKLMEGFVLLEATCPKCVGVPLVKNNHSVPKSLSRDENDLQTKVEQPAVVAATSFEQPFKPVSGVPVCVACDSHVITQETEIAILEQSATLKDKGSIYVALRESSDNVVSDVAAKFLKQYNAKKQIIHLEDVTEHDIVGGHRKKFLVDLSTTSFDDDGISHVEMAISPKMGANASKPIVVDDVIEEEEELDMDTTREIATKVLGAKMLQGWTLKENTCGSCAMPMMDYMGKESCPVCPALAKAVKKKRKAKEELRATKNDLAKAKMESIQAIKGDISSKAPMDEEEATQRAEERMRAIKEEKKRLLAIASPKNGDDNVPVAPETPKEKTQVAIEEYVDELERLEAIAKEEEERRHRLNQIKGKESELEQARADQMAMKEKYEQQLEEERKAIEAMDDDNCSTTTDKTGLMRKDQMVDALRKNMAEKMTLDDEVAKLEKERLEEAMEARRIAEERKAESEHRMIAALEADAAMKALAAEEAIRNAKAALQEVSDTKKHLLTQTIEQAEMEAVAETEEVLKERFEEHNEPVILQTDSEIEKERWETLRMEGRAIMTRRTLAGWNMTSNTCEVTQCHNAPLIEKDGCTECCVCGGDGSSSNFPKNPGNGASQEVTEEKTPPPPAIAKAVARSVREPAPNRNGKWVGSDQEAQFEKNREKYAKEIGKKMMQGWKIVDSSCPTCVMPLMMDDKGNNDLCIGCNKQIKHSHFDASTIATNDVGHIESKDEENGLETIPSDESDLVSTILRQAPKQQKKRKPVVTTDPPAYKPTITGSIHKPANSDTMIALPQNVDFADAEAIRALLGDDVLSQQGYDDSTIRSKEDSVEMVANLFLKSPHGYDFADFGKTMGLNEVKELVDIFLVTNVDKTVSEHFKYEVAARILTKLELREDAAAPVMSPKSPTQFASTKYHAPPDNFIFDDTDYTDPFAATMQKVRPKPFPEGSPRPPRSPQRRIISPRVRSPRDDVSVLSRASTCASDALESIYDRIDACKKKLLDPTNTLDEQIATAALLEKLAQAAVAVREMEVIE